MAQSAQVPTITFNVRQIEKSTKDRYSAVELFYQTESLNTLPYKKIV